jgi:Pyruvate/2-oxoacid:ferredoxin oxidoreductase delta subunit
MLDRDDHFVPDFDYCKGCGICARECKREAIRLLPEGEFRDDEG